VAVGDMTRQLHDGRMKFEAIVRASTLASIELVRASSAPPDEQARAITELLDFERECLEADCERKAVQVG
jgi:hypothetical protein